MCRCACRVSLLPELNPASCQVAWRPLGLDNLMPALMTGCFPVVCILYLFGLFIRKAISVEQLPRLFENGGKKWEMGWKVDSYVMS